jgi:hypothetical protein
MGEIMGLCPKCGRGNFSIYPEHQDWFNSALLGKIEMPEESKLIFVCNICKWSGGGDEFLTREEAINTKRTKLIDEMTNECSVERNME